ncbi:pilus assembly protein PilP [Pseudorhodoferax sp. Leaf274]|uniref:pilus assembly protein PilP n=1 Tax=Pseudorhodoferax sp. Leaf274 TaxID=1736318 RepID=UPI000702926A|nr:pilus assembly protein PilP [Pseudorhodoferax sp. Leaf274]KQP48532.1 pilus assembly protein PilP [Pseudorhodoferax sp. Leaf274]
MSGRHPAWVGLLLAAVALLGGCAGDDQGELQQWMAEQRGQVRPKVTPLSEPKQFVPQAYTQETSVDPFSQQRLASVLRQDAAPSAVNTGLIGPELARRKEPLEAFPLDAMSMVGSLRRGGSPVALVRVDNLIYQVRVGEHMGQNYGKVTKIDEAEVSLREIVQDGGGEWIERAASLQLQEKVK